MRRSKIAYADKLQINKKHTVIEITDKLKNFYSSYKIISLTYNGNNMYYDEVKRYIYELQIYVY